MRHALALNLAKSVSVIRMSVSGSTRFWPELAWVCHILEIGTFNAAGGLGYR